MTLINPNPVGHIKLDLKCKNCGNTIKFQNFTDGILEAMGQEPIRWICYINPRLSENDPKRGCGTGYRSSEVSKIVMYDDK